VRIEKIVIENFRLLKSCTLDMREKTTLLVGKNNTGKTSLVVLLEKFLDKPDSFTFWDFPLSVRSDLLSIDQHTDVQDLAIRLVIRVEYDQDDNLEILSEFMLDLDSSRRHTNILLECQLDKDEILKKLPETAKDKKKFIETNLSKFLAVSIYAFDDHGHPDTEGPYYRVKRDQLEMRERGNLKRLINFQIIHARRNVASSEDGSKTAKPLSAVSTSFFKKKGDGDSDSLNGIRDKLAEIDEQMTDEYKAVFGDFLRNSRNFLGLSELQVISNIQAQNLIENSSQVIYGERESYLQEQYSGLGYLNILYLLLQIEVRRETFAETKAPLNLLIIEEPEAHTHPQMQYVFAGQIQTLLGSINNLQTIMTTHSSHIVAKSDFEDIRYMSKKDNESVVIKNFHNHLEKSYKEKFPKDHAKFFKFVKQYININSAELFFANKVIFIEGDTESILLPLFLKKHDKEMAADSGDGLMSQNITVLEVGANAKIFEPFMTFMGIKTLVLTDIDSVKQAETDQKGGSGKTTPYDEHKVEGSTHTSNATLEFFYKAPKRTETTKYEQWYSALKAGGHPPFSDIFNVKYQLKENGYHARSFEDAFISLNYAEICKNKENIQGLKNRKFLIENGEKNYYELTEKILSKKSDFAASILLIALTQDDENDEKIDWVVPEYIKEGLKWLQKD
jgi:putative ATP-dependent endonuclease of the OLD family